MSTIKVNRILTSSGGEGVDADIVGNVTGNVTAPASVTVGLTTIHSTSATFHDINTTGVITATSFSGDGSSLSGIDATTLKDSGGTIRVQANTSGAVVSGMITVGNSFIKDEAVGLGTTTTAGRDAGINTAPGTIIYNSTVGAVEVYKQHKGWVAIDNTGEYPSVNIGYLVVGGGGAGGGQICGGGGAGGLLESSSYDITPGTYTVTVGAGGVADTYGGTGTATNGDPGNPSVFGDFVAIGGGRGGNYGVGGAYGPGGAGGSGGGGGAAINSPSPGTDGGGGWGLSPSTPAPIIAGFPLYTPGDTQGYPGGSQLSSGNGGGGGGAGGQGQDGGYPSTGVFGDGGVGKIVTIVPAPIATSRSVGEVSGSNVYFAGGGGGGGGWGGQSRGTGGQGGLGGGGNGGGPTGSGSVNGTAGTVNTGGGGGAPDWNGGNDGTPGGSGVVILRGPNLTTFTFTGGVTYTTDTDGNNKIYIITATSTTSETVTIPEEP